MKMYVRNMYNRRTVSILKDEMDRLNIKYKKIELGEISFYDDIKLRDIYNLDRSLYVYRLSLILINSKLVTDIRDAILEMVRQNIRPEPNFSDHLTKKLGYNFAYLNMYFTLETGLSIEQYYNLKSLESISYSDPHYKN
jgi:hypothetical protein